MPRNKGKRGEPRTRRKNKANYEKHKLVFVVFKEDGEEYAQVIRMLDNGRCEAMCMDGTYRRCHIPEEMHKKVRIAADDIILVRLHDGQEEKADVIPKYMPDEARLLKAYGEFPGNIHLNQGIAGGIAGLATMPKKKGKIGKIRTRRKNKANYEKHELVFVVFKEDGEEYAQVLRMLDNGRCEAMCMDGTYRQCHIPEEMHKKVRIAAGDIILVRLHDGQEAKADVILKYMPDEARLLKAYGELPGNIHLNQGIAGRIHDDGDEAGCEHYIEFEYEQ